MHKTAEGYEYPRVYRPAGFWHYAFLIMGLGIAGASLLGLWYFGTGHEVKGPKDGLMLESCCALMFLLGAYVAAYTVRARLVLYQDRLECSGVFVTRTMARHNVLGWRRVDTPQGPSQFVLQARDGGRSLKVPDLFDDCGALLVWLRNSTDLEQREQQQFQNDAETNPALGASAGERTQTVSQARTICRVLLIATIAACAWTWFYPRPYQLAVFVLAALPWLAIYVTARYKGIVVINEKRCDPHPGVGIPFIMPGLVLMLRVIYDMTPLGWQRPLLMAAILSAVLSFAAWKVDPAIQAKPAIVILLFLLSLAYGYGVNMQVNALFDTSEAEVFRTQVTDKYISSGRSRSYYLKLAPWGPMTKGDRVQVSHSMYDAEQVGQDVCIGLRQGALRIPWYFVRECR